MATAGGCGSEEGAWWKAEREAKIKALLSEMTLQEKIMQIGQVDKAYIKDLDDVRLYSIGSIISGGSGQVGGMWDHRDDRVGRDQPTDGQSKSDLP